MSTDVALVHEDLCRAGLLVPVVLGGDEELSWVDCELASLAENRLGDPTPPHKLEAARRADWIAHATTEASVILPRSRRDRQACYWLFDEGERIGTVALSTDTLGSNRVRLSSLYVLPSHRGRGLGRRVMFRVMDAVGNHGFFLRLETSWSWQRTVRFYVELGFWVDMWKRDLDFVWDPMTPPPRIEVGEEHACLSVVVDEKAIPLARARRAGDWLEVSEPSKELLKEKRLARRLGSASSHATSTLALSLALEGFPLVRSAEAWEELRDAERGPPEALAYKIMIWEAWDRAHGWQVSAPRVAGLEYPTWEELELRWKQERESFLVLPLKR